MYNIDINYSINYFGDEIRIKKAIEKVGDLENKI